MKPKYLETYDYRKYKEYCSTKCINIVYEQNDKEGNEKVKLRGMYKGYLFGMKLFSTLHKREKRVMNYEVYNHLKFYLSSKCTLWGEDMAIRDIMNLMCDDNPNI